MTIRNLEYGVAVKLYCVHNSCPTDCILAQIDLRCNWLIEITEDYFYCLTLQVKYLTPSPFVLISLYIMLLKMCFSTRILRDR